MLDSNSIFSPTDLDPELKSHICDIGSGLLALRHPLVYSVPYFEAENQLLNWRLYKAKAIVDEAYLQKDFFRYIAWHETPHHLSALLRVVDQLNDVDYWAAIRDVWIESENIWQNAADWRRLWISDRCSRRESVMDEADIAAFDALPDIVQAHRGFSRSNAQLGMSWTTDKETAVWFAKRYLDRQNPSCMVATVPIRKCDILAFFGSRGESEIVINSADVRKHISIERV